MKRNVDLTEKQMFTTPEFPTESAKLFSDAKLAKLIADNLKVPKPWASENYLHLITTDLDFDDIAKQRSVFAVGSKKERQNWKLNHAYDTNQICKICGQKKDKKPWARNRCNCYSISTPKIPWKS